MNYGPRTLQQLFLTYAFVPQPLPVSALSVPLSLGLPADKQRPPPTQLVELLPDGCTTGAAEQVPALHGFSVPTWARNILAAIERNATPLKASADEDERLAAAMVEAEAKLLRGFIEKSTAV